MVKPTILPIDLERRLAVIGGNLEKGKSIAAELPAALAGISALPATAISQAAPAIAHTAKLYRWRREPSLLEALFRRRLTDKEQLMRLPDAAYLFLFHMDGRIRELSLQRISGALPSSFVFAAVVLRLNDWVPQVRAAALACTERCLPLTAADAIAGAATALLLRQDSWGRWNKEREVVDLAFSRPDVASRLASLLADAPTGPASRVLRRALNNDAMDVHLERLATEARQPSVRALALQSIADGRAAWPAGLEWKWLDKSMGRRVRVPRFEYRAISIRFDRAKALRTAANDRSAMVRRAALDALVRLGCDSDEAKELAGSLLADPSPSVRERAAFIIQLGSSTGSLNA